MITGAAELVFFVTETINTVRNGNQANSHTFLQVIFETSIVAAFDEVKGCLLNKVTSVKTKTSAPFKIFTVDYRQSVGVKRLRGKVYIM